MLLLNSQFVVINTINPLEVALAEKGGPHWRLQLRRRYPNIEFGWFREILVLIGPDDPEALHRELEVEEAKAVQAEAKRQARLAELVRQISVSETHRQINIVTSDVDLEHVQAILAYGFAMPGSQRAFAGSASLPLRHILSNVRRKLLAAFEERKFQAAWSFLTSNGVVIVHTKGQGETYSLNTGAHRKGLTDQGKAIVQEMKRFLREKK